MAATADGQRIVELIEEIRDARLLVHLPHVANPVFVEGIRGFWGWLYDSPMIVRERHPSRNYFEFAAQHHERYFSLRRVLRAAYADRDWRSATPSGPEFAKDILPTDHPALHDLSILWYKANEVEKRRAAHDGPRSVSEIKETCACLVDAERRASADEVTSMIRAIIEVSMLGSL